MPIKRRDVIVTQLWGLCEGCTMRTKEQPQQLTARHLFRLTAIFFGERLPVTNALCRECWRLLKELRQVDVGLHSINEDEVDP